MAVVLKKKVPQKKAPDDKSEMKTGRRVRCVRLELEKRSLDGLLVTDIKNIRHLTGFTGSSAFVLITPDGAWFLTDSRYTAQARQEVKGYRFRIYKKALDSILELVKFLRVKSLGFEGNNLSYDNYLRFKKALGAVRLRSVPDVTAGLRLRKDSAEIERIKASAAILDGGYLKAMDAIRPGVIEKDAALRIEFSFRENGADGLAFDTIIASGTRGALPHGKASDKPVRKGELVVVDMGVEKDGYNSDETRTFSVGKAGGEEKKIYQIVKDAQERAIGLIRPGVRAAAVDKAARGCIEGAGYGRYFGHGTGHGVGLDVHEGPNLGPTSKDVLEEGMVVTVEPGIYIPGWGGVRIEDMVLVVKDGFEVLTGTTKDLVCL